MQESHVRGVALARCYIYSKKCLSTKDLSCCLDNNIENKVDNTAPYIPFDSFFGKFELPNLDQRKVRSVSVIVSHVLDKPKM